MNKSSSTVILTVLICAALIVNYSVFSKIITDSVPEASYPKTVSDSPESGGDEDEEKNAFNEADYRKITADASDAKCGELILVNKKNMYDFDAEPTLFEKELPESIYESKSDIYYVKNINISLNKTAINALNELLQDFYEQTGHSDIIIVDAYRSFETQQAVLDAKIAQLGEEQGRLIAQDPGSSEHHTGYALDLSLYLYNRQQDYNGTGDYEWITQNCYKYGFVIRYPEGKTNLTGIDYEPWHLRYVGRPHSDYMTKNNLCLEEYIEKLSYYPVNSAGLEITTEDGGVYRVYSCPLNPEGQTEIMVPAQGSYSLSGDNDGHIIVTAVKQQPNAESSAQTSAQPEANGGADEASDGNSEQQNQDRDEEQSV